MEQSVQTPSDTRKKTDMEVELGDMENQIYFWPNTLMQGWLLEPSLDINNESFDDNHQKCEYND